MTAVVTTYMKQCQRGRHAPVNHRGRWRCDCPCHLGNVATPWWTRPTSRADAHTCHASGCDVHVPPRMFMCRKHWRMVTYGLRVAVWAEYQPGQERLDGTAFPTDAYLEVTREAIEAVAAKEGRRGR